MVKIKHVIGRIFNYIHRLVFGSEAGAGTHVFFKNIGYTGAGAIGSTLFLFAVNTVAVRALGPLEYGKYILVLSTANFMIIPMVMGLQVSLMKHVPRTKEDSRMRATIIATAFWLVVFATAVFGIIAYAVRGYIVAWFAIPALVFIWAIPYSAILAYKEYVDGVVKGLRQFGRQAIVSVAYAGVICAIFFYLFFAVERTFLIYVWAVMAGFFFYSLVLMAWNGARIHPSLISKSAARDLMAYGLLSLLNTPSWFIITNADKFLMNRFFDVGAVGLYAVYMSTSMIIMGRGLSFFTNVFFPTAAGISDIAAVNRKINRALAVFAVPVIALNILIMYGMFLIYGSAYPFNFFFAAVFSLSGILYSAVHIKWSMIMTRSEAALRYYGWVSLGGAIISFALNYWLIQYMGIAGAVLSAFVTYGYFLVVAAYYTHPRP